LEFNQPVILSDTSNIKCTDTNKVDKVFYIEKDSFNKRSFKIKANWSEEKNYIFSVLPGAFKSLHGLSNDSITINFRTLKRSNYGNLICVFDSLDSKNQYIIQLKQKDRLIEEQIISNKEKAEVRFVGIDPGNYSVDVILDENKNGRWNGGDYFKKLQSEKIIRFQLNELKKNWDQSQNLSLKQ